MEERSLTYYVLCCPGRTPTVQGGVQVWDTNREGHYPAYLETLRRGYYGNNRGPITIFEDDCDLPIGIGNYIDSFSGFIERSGHPIQWWWNGYMWKPEPWCVRVRPLLVHRRASKFLSTQAVTYPRTVAQFLISFLTSNLGRVQSDDLGRRHGGDYWVGRALHELNQDFLIHWPPIAQHVGDQSLVAPDMSLNDGFRTNPYYTREDAQRIVQTRFSPCVLYPGEYDEGR